MMFCIQNGSVAAAVPAPSGAEHDVPSPETAVASALNSAPVNIRVRCIGCGVGSLSALEIVRVLSLAKHPGEISLTYTFAL